MVKKRRSGGFTLIELMIVVAIIGILAAIAIPKFADLVRKSGEGASRGNLGALRSSLSIYYSDMEGQYPSDLASLTIGSKFLGAVPMAKTPNYHLDASWDHIGNVTQFADGGEWQYDGLAADANLGMVWVDCAHTDTKGSYWSSY